jgi:hypothetical protein
VSNWLYAKGMQSCDPKWRMSENNSMCQEWWYKYNEGNRNFDRVNRGKLSITLYYYIFSNFIQFVKDDRELKWFSICYKL